MFAFPIFFAKYWRILVVIAAAGALVWGYFAWQNHQRGIGAQQERTIWEGKIAEQKLEAQAKLDEERDKTRDVEHKLADARTSQETKDTTNANTIKTLSGELAAAKRLRDPYVKPGRGCSSSGAKGADTASASTSAGDGAEGAGFLSEGLSDLLRDLTRQADEINIAYQSCRQDSMNVRELMK